MSMSMSRIQFKKLEPGSSSYCFILLLLILLLLLPFGRSNESRWARVLGAAGGWEQEDE